MSLLPPCQLLLNFHLLIGCEGRGGLSTRAGNYDSASEQCCVDLFCSWVMELWSDRDGLREMLEPFLVQEEETSKSLLHFCTFGFSV